VGDQIKRQQNGKSGKARNSKFSYKNLQEVNIAVDGKILLKRMMEVHEGLNWI